MANSCEDESSIFRRAFPDRSAGCYLTGRLSGATDILGGGSTILLKLLGKKNILLLAGTKTGLTGFSLAPQGLLL